MPLILGTNSIKDTGYDVANSCRFNDGSSDTLQRSPSSASNRRTWTWSCWVKRSTISTTQVIFVGGSPNTWIRFRSDDKLELFAQEDYKVDVTTNMLFRDVSAWYHIVVAVDLTQGTESNRVKIYVNGSLVDVTITYAVQNYDMGINNTGTHYVGRLNYVAVQYIDMYLSEMVLIDGTQNAVTDFGEFDSDSPTIWKPIDVSGLTFGTNGFYLDFEDSSALGNDANGSNNFTVNNLTAIDQSTDTCTNNFATLNPLNSTGNGTEPTYSEGNLQSVSPSSGGGFVGSSTIGVSSGKWFFELQRSAGSSSNVYIGIGDETSTPEIARQSASAIYAGNQVFYKPDDGNKVIVTNGSGVETSYGATYGNGDIIGIALNMDDNQVTFYKNGASQGVISIPTPDGFCFLNIVNGADTSDTFQVNFGSPPYSESGGNSDGNGYGNFSMAVPSGYYALNTKNLAEYG